MSHLFSFDHSFIWVRSVLFFFFSQFLILIDSVVTKIDEATGVVAGTIRK